MESNYTSETFESVERPTTTRDISPCSPRNSLVSSAEQPAEQGPSYEDQYHTESLLQNNSSLLEDEAPPLTASHHGALPNDLTRYCWDRIGKRALSMLVFGTWCVSGALAFLSFLWIESHRASKGGTPGSAWQAVVFSGWTTILITISAALIRTIMASQAATLTAMLASLFLENASVDLQYLPAFSIVRAVNLSPISLLGPHLFSFPKTRSVSAVIYSMLVVTLSLLVLASQFISSMLLSDLSTLSVVGQNVSQTASCYYTFPGGYIRKPFMLDAEPVFSPRFAEHREPVRDGFNSSDIGYVDTGITLRAVVPWANSNSRLGLKYYAGPIHLWDSRAICFSPDLNNATFNIMHSEMYGNFAIHEFHPDITVTGNEAVKINCTLDDSNRHPISICQAQLGYDVALFTTILTEKQRKSQMHMIVRSQSLPNEEIRFTNDSAPIFTLFNTTTDVSTIWSVRREGPWVKAFDAKGTERLSFSACVMNDATYDSEGSMFGYPTVGEPLFQEAGKLGILEPLNDTLRLRRQLGVAQANLSTEGRGLLSLDVRRNQVFQYYQGFGLSQAEDALRMERYWIPSMEPSLPTTRSTLHKALIKLFYDILDTTENPAFAMQALSTVFMRHAYYQLSPGGLLNDSLLSLQNSTAKCDVSYSMMTEAYVPVRKAGILSVVGIIAIYYLLLVAIILLFAIHTQVSLLGNSWQAVAQVVSDDTLEVLDRADKLKDVEVQKYLKDSALVLNTRGVIRRRKDGREGFEVEKQGMSD